MGDGTGIAWTDATWNPVRGCSRVSRGCEHCYAEGVARRFSGPGMPYEGLVRLTPEGKPKAQWNGTVRLVPEHLADPLRWTKPRRVFVNSMSDLFHEALSFDDVARVFAVMIASPAHSFQVLTKRPARMREFMATCDLRVESAGRDLAREIEACHVNNDEPWPPANVWLGVSVEDQRAADERIPVLLDTPAAVRWVSYEPAIGPVDWPSLGVIAPSRGTWTHGGTYEVRSGLHWIVVGGESGPSARPFAIEWASRTIAQCRTAGVPAFVKQLGALTVTEERPGLEPGTWGWSFPRWADRKGGDPAEWPADLRVREFPQVRS